MLQRCNILTSRLCFQLQSRHEAAFVARQPFHVSEKHFRGNWSICHNLQSQIKTKEKQWKKEDQSENFFSLAEDLIWKRDTGKREQEEEDGSNQATQSCSHGFSLRWQKLLGNPVCSGVNTSSDDKIPFKASFSLSHDNVLPHICTTICLAHYKRFNLKQCCVLFLLERVNLWTRMTPRLRRLSTRISRLETR